ncbi:MAG TPA: envelope stress response membrane protein PspC [Geminicoccaceae bacterium]|jgi:phage shock protein C|nr:envelope stress response membrane protein PspC [Geminicoccaceae bacterium]
MTWCSRDRQRPSWGRLYRDGRRAWLAGVCAGIADYFGLNPSLVRALTVASAVFFTFPTVVAYIIAAFALPRRPAELYDSPEEEAFWRSVRLEPGRTAHDLARKFQELERRLRAAEARVTSSEFKLQRQFKDLES